MRKRRRTRYTWFPTIGASGGVAVQNDVNGRPFQLTLAPNGSTSIAITALTFDAPAEAEDLNINGVGELANALGAEYIIERIVGKLQIAIQQQRNADNDPSTPLAALVAAGFFVARSGDGLDDVLPIGASGNVVTQLTSYNPLHPDCIREPWMWRRTWLLSNQAHNVLGAGGSTIASGPASSVFPRSTAEYGNGHSGGHVDVTVSRRVSNDDRLFFVIAANKFPVDSEQLFNDSLDIRGYLDVRILGALRKARQHGAF